MKKVGMLCLSILVLCWGLLGCTNGEEIPSASGVSSETASEEGGPVVICADESFREDLKELISYLAATGNETEYELLVLPDDTEDREPELTRLRTEIMAGEGPDAFILNATIPGYVTDLSTMEPTEALFPWDGDRLRGTFGGPLPQRGKEHVLPPVSRSGRDGAKQRDH